MTNKLNTIQFVTNIEQSGNSRRVRLPFRVGGLPPVNNFGIAQIDGDIQYNGTAIFPNPICAKEIRLKENLATDVQLKDGSANYIALKSPDTLAVNTTYTLPLDGLAGNLLSTDGAGVLSFIPDVSADDVNSLNTFTTDNAILKVDLPNGTRHIQETTVLLDDNANYSNVQSVNLLQEAKDNTWYGYNTMAPTGVGQNNTIFGSNACPVIDSASGNVFIGTESGTLFDSGQSNTVIGDQACQALTSAQANVYIGTGSGIAATNGVWNTAVGFGALDKITTGSNNTCIGILAGTSLTLNNGSNIMIGNSGIVGDNMVTRIGTIQTSCFIKGIHNVTPSGASETVIIDSSGELGSQAGLGSSPDSTGVLSGGLLTINADTTKFDISDGNGLVYNPTTLVKTAVSWTGLTAQDNGGWTGILTYVSINSAGAVVYNTSKVTNAQTRSQIFLGVLVHVNAVNIDTTNDEQVALVNYVNSIRDLSEALGFINISGNTMSASGANLKIIKSSGQMFKFGSNWAIADDNPHVISLASIDTGGAGVFQYRALDGTGSVLTLTDIIPNILDDGSPYPGTTYGNNRYGVSRIYTFTSNNLKIQPPQFDYSNLDDALTAINTEAFITEPSIADNGMLIGFLITRGNTTDLTNSNNAVFISAGKLGTISSTGGSGGDASTNISTSVLNRACVFADTTGKLLAQDSAVVINSGLISGLTGLTSSANLNLTGSSITIVDSDVGGLLFDDSTSAFNVSMKASALTTESHDIILPVAAATVNGQSLVSTTGGITSWSTPLYTPSFIYNCGLAFNTVSIVNVKAGNCIDSTNTFNIIIGSPLTMTMSSTGSAGGMQVAEASSTMYQIYVIADTNGVNAVNTWGVPQGAAISLPATHDVFRLMGHVKNDSGSDILNFVMHNRQATRHYQYQESRFDMEIFDGSGTANVFITQDLGTLIPATGVSMCDFSVQLDTDNDSDKFYAQSGINPQSTGSSLQVFGTGIVAASFGFYDFMIYNQAINPTGGTSSQPSFEWGTDVTGQATTISISAYTQNL